MSRGDTAGGRPPRPKPTPARQMAGGDVSPESAATPAQEEVRLETPEGPVRVRLLGKSVPASGTPTLLLLGFWPEEAADPASPEPRDEAWAVARELADLGPEALLEAFRRRRPYRPPPEGDMPARAARGGGRRRPGRGEGRDGR